MRILARKALVAFWSLHPDAKTNLEAWYHEAKGASWASSADIKALYRSASIIGKSRVVFNICGNKYRLVVQINYSLHVIYIRFIGTHKEYDRIDVGSV